MITLQTQVPEALYQQAKQLAEREELTLDQLVMIALSAQVAAWSTHDHLAERAQRGSWEDVLDILAKVPDVEPDPRDVL